MPAESYAASLYSPLLASVFAWFGARVVYGLGIQVSRERRALEKQREMGSYRLEERLGEGGMGEVWRASHRLLARPAAIKLVRPDAFATDPAGGRRALERFENEAQATAALQSPHTIELYDFGFTDDDAFYYVMELLHGVNLDTLVRDFGALPPERVAYLTRQACESLAEAHENGMVHRDVKPANLHTCRLAREVDFVKVLDFGLVKSVATDGAASRMTGEHTAVGTPAFMSPEQVLGARELDGRADLYSLGCVMYWLLTGDTVFPGGSAMEVMMHHARSEPEPPSRRSETEIPEELEEIVLTCLSKDPGARPASADAVSEALAGCRFAAEWTPERARRWWDTHFPREALS